MEREWNYLDLSDRKTLLNSSENAMNLIWMAYGAAKAALENGKEKQSLQNVLTIATISAMCSNHVEPIENRSFKALPSPDIYFYMIENRLQHIYREIMQCNGGDKPKNHQYFFLMPEAMDRLMQAAINMIIHCGLFERTGEFVLCPVCQCQVKRMAHHDGENWIFFEGCDNDCRDNQVIPVNPAQFLRFNIGETVTHHDLILANYQIM